MDATIRVRDIPDLKEFLIELRHFLRHLDEEFMMLDEGYFFEVYDDDYDDEPSPNRDGLEVKVRKDGAELVVMGARQLHYEDGMRARAQELLGQIAELTDGESENEKEWD